MSGKIFISYRRDDDPGFTGRLYDRLEHEFETDRLFIDVDGIDAGLDFVQVADEQIAQCDVVLVVIGRGWLDAAGKHGERRLDNAEDFVRIEIGSALRRKKRVIPVLVNNAQMPQARDLPEPLRPLARRNAFRLTHERFQADSTGLVRVLRRALVGQAYPNRKTARSEKEQGLGEKPGNEESGQLCCHVGRVKPLRPAEPIAVSPALHSAVTPKRPKLSDAQGSVERVHRVGVGLLSSIACDGDEHGRHLADAVIGGIASELLSMNLAEIYDYRDMRDEVHGVSDGHGPDLLLRASVRQIDDEPELSLRLIETGTQKLIGRQAVTINGDDRDGIESSPIAGCIGRSVDYIAQYLAQVDEGRGLRTANTPYHAINRMFRLGSPSLTKTEDLLNEAFAESGDTVHLALLAYLNSFHVGEHWGRYDNEVREHTRFLTNEVLSANSFNCIALAMAGHARGYILHEFPLSGDMLRQAVELGPNQPICWDHLALHHFYLGDYDEAMAAARNAVHIGAFSPLRFTYETTVCMIATMQGDYRTAIEYGGRALSRRPSYGAALRYSAASLGLQGQHTEAHDLITRIHSMEPDFSLEWVHENRLAVTDADAKERLIAGFTNAGLH